MGAFGPLRVPWERSDRATADGWQQERDGEVLESHDDKVMKKTNDFVVDEHDASVTDADMGRSMATGVRWIGGLRMTAQVIQILGTLVLSRLLTPAQFGLVAIGFIVTGFFDRVVGDTGTSTAIVQNGTVTQGLLSSILWLNLALGTTVALAVGLLSPSIASLLGNSDASDVVRVLGSVAFLKSATYVPAALLRRTRQFKKLAILDFTNAVVTTGATIGFAVAGFEEWSLVWGFLAGTGVYAILLWVRNDWKPNARFSPSSLRTISGFSSAITIRNVFTYFSAFGDRIVVGRFVGTTALGYYGLANRVIKTPLQTTVQTYKSVVLPNLSKVQDDVDRMRSTYLRSVSGVAYIMLPLCMIIAAVAEPMVPIVLGNRWIPATDLISILALVGAFQSLGLTTGPVHVARGRADIVLWWNVFATVVLMGCYLLGSLWGVEGVALGFLGGQAALLFPAFWLAMRQVSGSLIQVLGVVVEPFVASVLAGLAAYAPQLVMDNNWIQLITGLIAGGLVYLAYSLFRKPAGFQDTLKLVSGVKPARRKAG